MTGPISSQWVLDHLEIDAGTFWRTPDPLDVVDPEAVMAIVAAEHAVEDFPLLLETTDPEADYLATVGRMISSTIVGRGPDWPLDRSWFHYLYIDLARLDGEFGMDLSSDEQLRTATRMYWDCVRELVREMKPEVVAEDKAEVDRLELDVVEAEMPKVQLALF